MNRIFHCALLGIAITFVPTQGCQEAFDDEAAPHQLAERSAYSLTAGSPGLQGAYYSGKNFQTLVTERADAVVDFNWSSGSPVSALNKDLFSVRWSGHISPQTSEEYTFYTYADDGVRLTVDGQTIIDRWTDQAAREDLGKIQLQAGQSYDIELEYYENKGKARVSLSWSSPTVPKSIIPAARLTHGASSAPTYATLFGDQIPANAVEQNDTQGVELGVKFRSQKAGTLHGVRFYRGATSPTGYTVRLWSSSGAQLATAQLAPDQGAAPGWARGAL